jgi:hypothetical protein
VHNRTDAAGPTGEDHRRDSRRTERNVPVVTAVKDLVGVLLLVFVLPLWMALGLGFVGVLVVRHLYWWSRGNTTVVSRGSGRSTPAPLPRPV